MYFFRIIFAVFLITRFVGTVVALPIGHEAGFLGNTTSRPGDIGAAINFPSATAFMNNEETRIYFGLIYTRQDIEIEGAGSKFEGQFIPYFTGFATKLFGITFTNFITYSGTNNGQLKFEQKFVDGIASIQAEETVMGISAAKKFDKNFALGVSLSLDIQSTKSFTSASGTFGGNDYVASIQDVGKYIIGNARISASFENRGSFLSASIFFPGVKLSSKATTDSLILVDGSGINKSTTTTRPDIESNFGLNFGYSYLNSSWRPSFDIFYDLSSKGLNLEEGSNRTFSFADSYYLKFGLESPEYQLQTLFKGTSISYLFGLEVSESVEDEITTDETNRTGQVTFGIKLASKNTSPIFGLYYQDQKTDTKASIFGLMYSSNYNIFD